MKRLGVLWIILLLASCAPKEEQPEQVKREKVSQVHTISNEQFHFVAGFLTDEEIVYVVKEAEGFELQTFHLQSGETKTIWQSDAPIVDVLFHPAEPVLYVQTATTQYQGNLHIIQSDGQLLRTIDFEGSEIYVALNEREVETFAYTVFADDWSFETFIYDGKERYTRWIETAPFPFPIYWKDSLYGLAEAEHPLEGSAIGKFNEVSETVSIEREGSFIAAFPKGEAMNTMAIDDDEFVYEVNGETYRVPAVSNYGSWVVPPYAWTEDGQLLTLVAEERAELDELLNGWTLVALKDGKQTVVSEGLMMQYELKCAPSGQRCLTGERYEEVLQGEEQFPWLKVE